MGYLFTLASACIEATTLALLGVFLYNLHRKVGIVPFLFLVAAFAFLVPLAAHASSLDFGTQGATPRVFATVVPAFMALVLLLHVTTGRRNAQLTAAMPLLAGMLAAAAVAISGLTTFFIPREALPPLGTGALAAGFAVALATLAMLLVFHGVYRLSDRAPLVPVFVLAVLAGLVVQSVLLYGAAVAGLAPPGAPWHTTAAVPLITGILPAILVAVSTEVRLSTLGRELRRELLTRPPFGTTTLVDERLHAEMRYREGLVEGREAARVYVDILETLPDGAFVCDGKGILGYTNQALAKMMDRYDDELVGENITHLLFQRHRRGFKVADESILEPGRHRLYLRLPSGKGRPVEVTVRQGRAGQLQGRVRDLTQEVLRREAERQRQRADVALSLLRDDITHAMQASIDRLEGVQQDAALAQGPRHELDQAVRHLRDVEELIRRLDVLGAAEGLTPEPLDGARLFEGVAKRFSREHGRDLRLELDMPTEPVVVLGSELLEEVFANLFSNALEHAGPPAKVDAGVERGADGAWVFYVDDHGPGVPDAFKETIFAAPVDNGNGDSPSSAGLGLHTVRTIVEALGGRVWVEDRQADQPGSGASFKVQVPAAPSRATAWKGVASEGATRGEGPGSAPAEA